MILHAVLSKVSDVSLFFNQIWGKNTLSVWKNRWSPWATGEDNGLWMGPTKSQKSWKQVNFTAEKVDIIKYECMVDILMKF